ncbi:MAG: YciI family protein [Nocardioidaceae bacterium]
MTQYMFMLFDDESWHEATESDWMEGMQAHRAFAEAVAAAGATVLDANALEHTRTATTVRNPGGSEGPLTTDGPFIETKEAIGGYYVIEARDLDQALELAATCPSPIVEVRPVLDTSGNADTRGA